MSSDVEEIKSRVDIVGLVGEYVKLQKAGANWKAPCPFHNEKTPSFTVSEEKQIWHCFGCGKGGDVFGFLMELEGLEFKEVLKILADKAGVQLSNYNPQVAGVKNKTLEILELATKFYEKQLWEGAGKDKILNYLRGRGLQDAVIKEFHLGYAPDGWRNMLSFLLGKGFLISDIEKTGLLVKKESAQISNHQNTKDPIQDTRYYDRFRDRIMFPVADYVGKVVGYSARVAPGGDESQAKYVNTPETEVYHKSKVLYGLDLAKTEIKNKDYVLLVEGNTDVMAAAQAGFKNTVAVSGTALTADHLVILRRYTENLKLLFDMDAAGQMAALKSAKLAFQKDCNVFMVELSEGKDAAELAAKDPEKLRRAIEEALPAMEYFFGQIFKKYDKNKAGDKKNIAKEALNIIASLENKIEKSHWLKQLARELEVEETVLTDILERDKTAEKRATPAKPAPAESGVKKRTEVMRDKIVGLMLVDDLIWQALAGSKDSILVDFLRKDELFRLLTEKGAPAEFKVDNILTDIESRGLGAKMRKMQFGARYEFNSQSGIEENIPGSNGALVEQYCKDIKKELCREKLELITRDLKKAEACGDSNAVKFLMEEFSKISKEMNC